MSADEGERVEVAAESQEVVSENRKRERSSIEFPYSDLGSAIEIARTINDRAGVECDVAQLAAWLGQSSTSGTFRARYSAARIFGLTETERGGRVKLTSLGREVLSPQKADKAKAQAFLNVELFRQLYDTHKGHVLPPADALERMVTSLGVGSKQADRARQTFLKSAQIARFIDQQTGAFIEPAYPSTNEPDPVSPAERASAQLERDGGGSGGAVDTLPKIDPIIKGLIDRLPETGSVWPSSERKLWLGILENSFQLVYKNDADEQRSPAERTDSPAERTEQWRGTGHPGST